MKYNPDFRCIKGISIDTVKTRTISEMGFPVDVTPKSDITNNSLLCSYVSKISYSNFSYLDIDKTYINFLIELSDKNKALLAILEKLDSFGVTIDELSIALQSSCLFNVEPFEAESLIEEFVFIIEKLLPRQLSDIYYSFDFEPNPAYAAFFDLAAEKLDLLRYTDPSKPSYGQFTTYPAEEIKRRFFAGESLLSLYGNTCATKAMIKDAISSTIHDKLVSIELTLFSLSKDYYYLRSIDTDNNAEFSLYKDCDKLFNIIYLSEIEFDKVNDIEAYLAKLSQIKYPLLIIDYFELNYEYNSEYVSSIIRNAIKNPEYLQTHTNLRSKMLGIEKVLRYSKNHYKSFQKAHLCGCFLCKNIFLPLDIQDWHFNNDEGHEDYVYCPKCGGASVIMDSQGYDISRGFLTELNEYIDYFYGLDDEYIE